MTTRGHVIDAWNRTNSQNPCPSGGTIRMSGFGMAVTLKFPNLLRNTFISESTLDVLGNGTDESRFTSAPGTTPGTRETTGIPARPIAALAIPSD